MNTGTTTYTADKTNFTRSLAWGHHMKTMSKCFHSLANMTYTTSCLKKKKKETELTAGILKIDQKRGSRDLPHLWTLNLHISYLDVRSLFLSLPAPLPPHSCPLPPPPPPFFQHWRWHNTLLHHPDSLHFIFLHFLIVAIRAVSASD